jgi:CheY-like chemotaxis protein
MILIVEDDADNAAAIREVLEDEGYKVARACDGVDALRAMRQGELPALIILDYMMPNLDGFHLAKALRGEPLWSEIPLVMLTANGRAANHALEVVDQCLHKPINLSELLDAIEKHYPHSSRSFA